jgi:Cu-processing system ATP-binding protein
MTYRLRICDLTRRFGDFTALDAVSFDMAPGERVALLGHNGAGKSTMMKIILGLLPATSGRVEVCGAAPGSARARGEVAYLPENVAFHPALTGAEMLAHYLALRGEGRHQVMALLDRVGLAHAAHRRIGTYSKGMRQRVGLAQALIGKPRLLVLDEPTSGLDPISRREFYGLLDALSAEGASILLSSHALTEVEARTDRILILSKGRKVAEGSLDSLRRAAALPVRLVLQPLNGAADAIVAALPGAERRGGQIAFSVAPEDKLAALSRVAALGKDLADVEVLPPSLEDLYSHFSQGGTA